MFAELFNRLMGPEPAEDRQEDYRHALAALLVRCARADEHLAPVELDQIDRILGQRYQSGPEEAKTLRGAGMALEEEAGDTVHLTRVIKEAVPYEERIGIVEALWSVVLADDDRDQEENAFLRLTVKLLGVNDRDSGLARQRVQGL
ncbi:TerB family tellurite resistance protein [Algicella marina]|uniref:TerB family tellurite resistance protein n=1 Tax=Algicella marina TaxID=2683284 RepID=A0A6P1SZA2_9RHOB|nr:TerB family tellurite resistance protein [Algicella marina]QHQ35077.1 TerB family tellurite resistance protein [Algicella marina]